MQSMQSVEITRHIYFKLLKLELSSSLRKRKLYKNHAKVANDCVKSIDCLT
jgi:hypothetical protein